MSTFSHNYGAYSVEGSLNYFLKQNLLTNAPAWMNVRTGQAGQNTLNFDYPEQPLVFPSFAVTHIGSDEMVAGTYQGDRADGANKGTSRFGMVEIDCWETSKDNFAWMQHLRQMRDMVYLLFQQHRAIPLYNLTVPTAPVALNAIVRVKPPNGIRELATGNDPNPATKRKRIMVTYWWTERF